VQERVAFPNVSPHDIRRTYATVCAETGLDPYTIKLLLNHATDKGDVTSRYILPSKRHVYSSAQRVAERLAEHVHKE